jgi:hypothetical protein
MAPDQLPDRTGARGKLLTDLLPVGQRNNKRFITHIMATAAGAIRLTVQCFPDFKIEPAFPAKPIFRFSGIFPSGRTIQTAVLIAALRALKMIPISTYLSNQTAALTSDFHRQNLHKPCPSASRLKTQPNT